MNVFRTATGQAIRDIITDHSQENRFGRTLTDADLDAICERVVDLFEMTLKLRAQLGGGHSMAAGEPAQSSGTRAQNPPRAVRWDEERTNLPSTRAASEIYDFAPLEKNNRADALAQVAPQKEADISFKLPRKRISVSGEERETLMRRAQSSAVAPHHVP